MGLYDFFVYFWAKSPFGAKIIKFYIFSFDGCIFYTLFVTLPRYDKPGITDIKE